ncbi:Hypothetical protein NGAL_HAMBI490_42930 [Neorhizobium galegae bv. officinalis]|uniref:hypothetical protein n=1 Tax=Neorhizobium sp. T7_12 TaxID=2093832 RepID=UPI00062233CE|nr:hypothetical protein [Neorhizobium sp. T7_12]CDZ29427.1 Hypothetical protein NGAL_HAMBI490_42930 [Neorhizobium galegae bv. officinalis]
MNNDNILDLTIDFFLKDGETKVVHEDANKTVVWTRQGNHVVEDVYHRNFQSLLEQNAEEAKAFSATGKLGTNVKVASIPASIYYAWEQEGITEDDVEMARRLNDPDYKKFRVNGLRL